MKRVLKNRTILVITAMLFLASGLFAQTPIPGYSDGALGNNYDNTGAAYVTVGKTIPLYARPDGYFHPSYDPATGNNLTPGFTWVWSITVGPANVTIGGSAANYTQVTGVNAGTSSTVHVVETPPLAWGTCVDAGTNMTVNVVAVPSIAYAAGLAATYNVCAGDPSLPVAIGTVISGGYQNFRLAWTLEIKTLKADLTDKDFYALNKSTTGVPLAVNYTQLAPEAVAASGAHAITSVAGGFTVIDNSTTVYTYSLNGLNDQASRFGDFIGLLPVPGVNGTSPDDFMYYDTAADLVTITVHPTPTTGPIFHIVGTWAN
jgi:hypothetical protein